MKQKIYLRFQAYNQKSVEEFKDNLVLFCQTHNIVFSSISLPIQKKKYTVLKSPHVNKRAKENFELNIYKFKLHTSINLSYIKLFRYNVPKNIHLKIIYSN